MNIIEKISGSVVYNGMASFYFYFFYSRLEIFDVKRQSSVAG